jgi:hypothetical protein
MVSGCLCSDAFNCHCHFCASAVFVAPGAETGCVFVEQRKEMDSFLAVLAFIFEKMRKESDVDHWDDFLKNHKYVRVITWR